MGVISLRLKDRDLERLDELSRLERKDRSTAARELLEYG
jgi:predicted DNA-binding protein